MELETIKYIPWVALLGAVLCLLCCTNQTLRKAAGPISVLSIFVPFILALSVYFNFEDGTSQIVTALPWITFGSFTADFAYFVDSLTMVMLFVVCGIGTLVALYATGYMAGDRGYARFFAGVSLFIFAMTSLVMADNLVLLYLGWEGVGLCSYLLIGYYYQKPAAVAAAKKAFIVNRVGDLGFALGIFLTYHVYQTVSLGGPDGIIALAVEKMNSGGTTTADLWIPFLLMIGAFGKSAQIPLHVWLPDAMEGPTPVSALIHAATMVTAGVYMIARLVPVFSLSPAALPTVAVIGGITALFAATIALCQYDLKRIYAYSTISQLGYMFLGVGALSTVGGIFHLFTHAFFKALLFLTAGSVMHAMAGQLDLRKISGLRQKMPVTCWLMFIGCLALAGFPLTAGFYSKDMILTAVVGRGVGEHGSSLFLALGILGLLTAFLTAFYTFRLWFRVFLGPVAFETGDENHGHEEAAGHGEPPEIEPHEMPFWPMNAPLVVLAIGAIVAGFAAEDWMGQRIGQSTANPAPNGSDHGHAPYNLHLLMQIISSAIAVAGIGLAFYFHVLNRAATDRLATAFSGLVKLVNHKYYIDEFYEKVIVRPLRLAGYTFYVLDELIINGLAYAVAMMPKLAGYGIRPTQHGRLQGYGLGMAAGLGVIVLLVLIVMNKP